MSLEAALALMALFGVIGWLAGIMSLSSKVEDAVRKGMITFGGEAWLTTKVPTRRPSPDPDGGSD